MHQEKISSFLAVVLLAFGCAAHQDTAGNHGLGYFNIRKRAAGHEEELRHSLLDKYDKVALPAVLTNLSVSFTVLSIDVDEQRQVIQLGTWVKMQWQDNRLSWSASSYPAIERLAIPSSTVWVPDLSLYNNDQMHLANHLAETHVVVWPSGKVLWVPTAHVPATCVMDMTYWPHDVHNCTVKFGSWVHSGHTIKLQPLEGSAGIELDIPEKTTNGRTLSRGQWEVINSTVSYNSKFYPCCPESYMSVVMEMIIQRNAPAFCWLVKCPAVVLSLLTAVLFLLPPGSVEKMVIGSLIILADIIFISHCSNIVDHSPSHTPLIVQFVGEQLLMTMLCVILSAFVVRLARDPHSDTLPPWLQKPAAVLETGLCLTGYRKMISQAGRRSYPNSASDPSKDPSEDQTVMVMDNSAVGHADKVVSCEWLLFAALLDRCLLLIYLAVFCIKLIAYNGII